MKAIIESIYNSLIEKVRNSRILVLFLILLLVLIRVAGDSLFVLSSSIDYSLTSIWKIITALMLSFLTFLYFFSFVIKKRIENNDYIQTYYNELYKLLFLQLSLVFLIIILPEIEFDKKIPTNAYTIIFSDLYSLLAILSSVFWFKFIWKWIKLRRRKNSMSYLSMTFYSLVILIAYEFYAIAIANTNSDSYIIVSNFILVFGSSLVIFADKNNAWLKKLDSKNKGKVLLYSIVSILLCLSVLVQINGNVYSANDALNYFSSGSVTFLRYILLTSIFYSSKNFIVCLLALPTTDIVERKTSELINITDFNKLITKSQNEAELLNYASKFALQGLDASFSWIELYINDKTEIGAFTYIPIEMLQKKIDSQILSHYFKSSNNPLIVESLNHNNEFDTVLKINNSLQSMIASPLYLDNERIGTLVLGKTEDYGFEFDDLNILAAFSSNLSIALENSRLIKQSIISEQYKRELILAKEMMEKLLPQKLPIVPYYDFAAITIPAEVVGGDYYDFVYLKNNKLCFIIGDVSGKGISAAFFMAQVKGITLALANESESASDLLMKINATLHNKIDKHLYITMTAVAIDNDSGRICIARAGHLPTLIVNKNGIQEIIGKGIGIGLAKSNLFDINLEEICIDLKDGEYCVIYTDGVTESRNNSDDELGFDNLKECILSNDYSNSYELIKLIQNCANEHSLDKKQHDDISVLSIKYSKIME